MSWTCTHCGRADCKVYGGPECEAERERLWQHWIKLLGIYADAQARHDAASSGNINDPDKR
jgi:hypothetical protein